MAVDILFAVSLLVAFMFEPTCIHDVGGDFTPLADRFE